MNTFCPNCEKETDSTLVCEVYLCNECNEDNGNYEKPAYALLKPLREELKHLRFKTSAQDRFIFWIWNVYARNVQDLILDIMGATTYDTEGEAREGKYSLPKHCFDLIKRIDEYTEKIYDGTYLDNKTSMVVNEPSNPDVSVTQDVLMDIKTSSDNNKPERT
ncbi:MAG: hypothetical protein UW63_C0093G0002 [Candidatus Uhrbacteria bacterium GW2011_GWF2_44_350]|uniref:Uncharacterized protein n=1 Tax=Candidatus Uhrbacteria bacterium GW2011_GWF2_44_350 TaxID=1619000 RepID=A0A0G1LGP3_9BACT|nr:MAG: hypothetical protein UW63_C0093G0002 [Candidatus Uhrbacteria bacterium GW2011_GWF2_44_350]